MYTSLSAQLEQCVCVPVSAAVHSVEPSGLITLTNMWAARPQKEQVGNVSLSLSHSVCSVLFASMGWGGDMCLCDTPWVWVVSGIT